MQVFVQETLAYSFVLFYQKLMNNVNGFIFVKKYCITVVNGLFSS